MEEGKVQIEVYTADDLCKMLGITRKTLWAWHKAETIPKQIAPKLWSRRIVNAWLSGNADPL